MWRASEGLWPPGALLGDGQVSFHAFAVSASGDAYITGTTTNGRNPVAITAKFGAGGNKLWEAVADMPPYAPGAVHSAGGRALALDPSGNVVIGATGYDGSGDDFLTIKYAANGTEVWRARPAAGSGPLSPRDPRVVRVGADGSSVVSGSARRDYQYSDYFTVKYNAQGIEQWQASAPGFTPYSYSASDAAIDKLGNIYVTGDHSGGDCLTIGYAPNGTERWRATCGAREVGIFIFASAIAVDGAGNVFVAGAASNGNFVLIKYDATGVEQWRSIRPGVQSGPSYVAGIALDAIGNVYVAGSGWSAQSADYVTIKFDAGGFEQWRAVSDGNVKRSDYSYALAVDRSGSVFVTGQSYTLDGGVFLTLKYDAAGTELWRVSGGAEPVERPWSIALGPDNGVYVAGQLSSAPDPQAIAIDKLTEPQGTIMTSSANASFAGQLVTFTALVPGNATKGSVDFRDGAVTLCAAMPVASGAATCISAALAIGKHSITAVYSGDGTNAGDTSAPLIQTVTPPRSTTALRASLNPIPVGSNVTLTARVSGNSPTGLVLFHDSGVVLDTAPLVPGTNGITTAAITTALVRSGRHALSATYLGDPGNAGSVSATWVETVGTPSSVALSSTSNPAGAGQPVTLTATVRGESPVGWVDIMDGGQRIDGCEVTLNSGGQARCTTTWSGAGPHVLTAGYNGDDNNAPAISAPLIETITAPAATTTSLVSSPNPSNSGQTVTFVASISRKSATGKIDFRDGAAAICTGVTVTSLGRRKGVGAKCATATLAAGIHTVTAYYSGDASNAASVSNTVSQVVH